MAEAGDATKQPDDVALLGFFRAIASRDTMEVARMLDASQRLASAPIRVAASRQEAGAYLLAAIRHYVYGGDTGLHIAAAAYQRETAVSLLAKGAHAAPPQSVPCSRTAPIRG